MNDLREYYQAYELVHCYEPYLPNPHTNDTTYQTPSPGLFQLSLAAEADTVGELLYLLPPKNTYYQNNNGLVIPFRLGKNQCFYCFSAKIGENLYFYSSGGTPKDCRHAFEMIYETYDAKVLFVINSWYASQIHEGNIMLYNNASRRFYSSYQLELL